MVEEAFDVFVSLKKVGFLPSVSTFNVSLLACLKVGRTDLVWKLYEHMLESADLVGFRVFNDLKDRGYFPDNIMYTTVNKGLCDIGWFGEARKLWFEMIHKGLVSNEYTYNVMIYGYCKIGDFVEARKLYEDMCGRGYAENVVSYTTMISGLCLHGKTD
ncbi:unnamed protein product [Trifolium pratense]|uniref:Uncharacterized protein n=1 Tax=Trifolium pratense TaxID=57577 RepID=A0ACB0INN3_TRIPR|nr:unnamed protein product [Trifolium pratense]